MGCLDGIFCWRATFYPLILIFHILIFSMAIAATSQSYSLEYFFANNPNVDGKMNSLGTTLAIIESLLSFLLYFLFVTRETTMRTRVEMVPQIVANTLINKIIYFFPILNFFAILTYSITFINEEEGDDDDNCVTSYGAFDDDTVVFYHPCKIHSIDGVSTVKQDCIDAGGDATFDCDYTAPAIWTATLVFMCFSLLFHILMALGTRVIVNNPETGNDASIISPISPSQYPIQSSPYQPSPYPPQQQPYPQQSYPPQYQPYPSQYQPSQYQQPNPPMYYSTDPPLVQAVLIQPPPAPLSVYEEVDAPSAPPLPKNM